MNELEFEEHSGVLVLGNQAMNIIEYRQKASDKHGYYFLTSVQKHTYDLIRFQEWNHGNLVREIKVEELGIILGQVRKQGYRMVIVLHNHFTKYPGPVTVSYMRHGSHDDYNSKGCRRNGGIEFSPDLPAIVKEEAKSFSDDMRDIYELYRTLIVD